MTADRARRHPVAKRSLGQNFLVDPNLQRKIVDALDPDPEDEVLEIGPGMGALTRHLARRVRRLVLVELDDELAARLRSEFADDDSVVILHRNVLDLDLVDALLDPPRAKVIGNIPYNITTPILFHLLEGVARPLQIVLMVQREVADRIVASAGGKTYGALAVGVQTVAQVQRLFHVGRNAFRPIPDVESTVLRITPHHPRRLDDTAVAAVRSLTRLAFGQRRKQFQRILRDGLGLSEEEVARLTEITGFDLTARPETFSPDEFVVLSVALTAMTS